jgi:hypothetical protein
MCMLHNLYSLANTVGMVRLMVQELYARFWLENAGKGRLGR